MKIRKKNINLATISRSTYISKSMIESRVREAEAVINDSEKNKRLKQQECPACYYLRGRVGGAAMTTTECGLCGKIIHFSSTCVDVVCEDCAKRNNLCKHCGGDIECKQRGKRILYFSRT